MIPERDTLRQDELTPIGRVMPKWPFAVIIVLSCALVASLAALGAVSRANIQSAQEGKSFRLNSYIHVRFTETSLTLNGRTSSWIKTDMNGDGATLNNGVPCFVVNASSGNRYRALYVNGLEEPISIHAHGLSPPNALDGVPYIGTSPLPSKSSVYVDFDVNNVNSFGSFFFHGHQSFLQTRGLSIPVIIKGDCRTPHDSN